MTARQYRRYRRWETVTRPAYSAGFLDGESFFSLGEDRPLEPGDDHEGPFDLSRYFSRRKRRDQMFQNHEAARERGRVDGWDQAKDRAVAEEREAEIDALATDFVGDVETWLRRAA